MDHRYDIENARITLEQFASEDQGPNDRRLAKMTSWLNGVEITCVDGPQTWRILKEESVESGEKVMDEAVFTIHGIVCGLDLPPILEKPPHRKRTVPARYKYMRQSLSVTGAGTSTFEEMITAAQEIYNQFHRQFPDGKLEKWNAAKYIGHSALNLSNRYFTPQKDAPDMVHIPFSKSVDPRGILEDMAKFECIHGEENIVHYYICFADGEGGRQYEVAKPQSYRIGDIVEIQMSFVAVSLKDQTFKMLSVLRSIALLDSTFTQDAQMKRMKGDVPEVKITLKRKVGYDTRGKNVKARMDILD